MRGLAVSQRHGDQPKVGFGASLLLLALLHLSGCGAASDSPLLGSWSSVGDLKLPAVESPEGNRVAHLELDLLPKRFRCRLLGPLQAGQKSGSWTVLRHVARRWEVRLTTDDDSPPVDLSIRFDSPTQISVVQIKGDDRVGRWTMMRSKAPTPL